MSSIQNGSFEWRMSLALILLLTDTLPHLASSINRTMLNFSAAKAHHSPLVAGLVSNSLLMRAVGPGQVPLIDLFIGAVSVDLFTRSITPPNQPSSEAVAKGEASDRMSQAITVNLGKTGGQVKHWLIRAGPMTTTVLGLWFKGWKGVDGFQHGDRLRNVFLAASALNILGAALRLWCFKTLGKFFTFQLAVADDQKVRMMQSKDHAHHTDIDTLPFTTRWSRQDPMVSGRVGYVCDSRRLS